MIEGFVGITVNEKGKKSPTWTLEDDLGGSASLAEILMHVKLSLIKIATDVLKEEQAKGFDKDPIVTVDGKYTKDITSVKPWGKIAFAARMSELTGLIELYRMIYERSPRDTGDYKAHNVVFLNSTAVARNMNEFNDWVKSSPELKGGDVIRFVNVMPYAGMLEREGVSAGRQKVRKEKSTDKRGRAADSMGNVRAPNGTYYLSYRAFKRKFGMNFKIFFDWTPGSMFSGADFPSRGPRSGNKLRRTFAPTNPLYKGPYVYPTIRVYIV